MRAIISLIGVVLTILVGVLLFNTIFGGGTPEPTTDVKSLADYATTDAEVKYTIDGQINGDDLHRTIQIIVSNDQRKINIIQGYQGRIISTQSTPNNVDAYSVFLAALDKAGFTEKRDTSLTEAGICPQGLRYNYDLTGTDGNDSHLWSASCEKGTFDGLRATTEDLFQDQISNYNKFTSDVDL